MSELTKITGIGPTRAAKLGEEGGIFTLEDLATADAEDVADLLGMGLEAAQAFIADARQLMVDDIPFGENDLVSRSPLADVLDEDEETAVYEHLLTGKREVKSVERGVK